MKKPCEFYFSTETIIMRKLLILLLYGQLEELFRQNNKIILSFRVGTSKNKYNHHLVKETCARHKLNIKPTTSLYTVIQQYQMYFLLCKYVCVCVCVCVSYCNLNEEDIRKN